MSKSTVQAIVNKTKRRIDQDVTDSDLDQLLLDNVNDANKIIKQWLQDAGINVEAGSSATLTTTASQEYIDLSLTPSAPTLALVTIGTGLITDGAHYYKVTFVTADGESIASSASSLVTTNATHNKVTVTIPLGLSSDVTSRKIYRTAAGGSSYLLLATISDNTTTTYLDDIADASLNATTAPTISTIPAYNDLIAISERTNDKDIELIPYERFVELYPDPTADTASTPEHCTLHNGRLYFGPTPTSAISIYIDFIKHLSELALTSNMLYDSQYDPVFIALVSELWTRWYDKSDSASIRLAQDYTLLVKHELITGASNNIGMNRQQQSRREDRGIHPKMPIS